MQKVRWCSASYPRCLCSLDGSWCASLSLSLSLILSLSLSGGTHTAAGVHGQQAFSRRAKR